MNGQRERLDHVSPVENQGDPLSFYSGCWWVGGAMVAGERRGPYDDGGTSREGGGGSRDCEVDT